VTGMLQMADTQDQISGSGSGFNPTATLLNYLLSDNSYMKMYHTKSGVRCIASSSNAEHTIECKTLLLLHLQANSSICLKATCISNVNDEVSYQYARESDWNVSE